MKHEELIPMMQGLIKRWIDVPQNVHYLDQDLVAKPHYISILYKESEMPNIAILNGHRVLTNPLLRSGFSIKTMIGDKKQGYGTGRVARNSLPRNTNAIQNLMDLTFDCSLKNALLSYNANIGDTISLNVENGFFHMSDDPVKGYIANEKSVGKIPTELVNTLIDWSKEVNSQKHVPQNNINLISNKELRSFADSQGRMIQDYSFAGDIKISLLVTHDKQFEMNFLESMPVIENWNKPIPLLEKKLEMIIKHSFNLKSASIPISDQYPVLFSGESMGTLFHEALGAHLLSGKYVTEGSSTTFRGQIGKQILPDFLTIIDDPQMKGSYGYFKYDDEGIEGKKIVLIKDGVLKNYLLDRDSAYALKSLSNGHARMEWVVLQDEFGTLSASHPEPRVGNLNILSSKCIPDNELVEYMKKYCVDNKHECGLYIESGSGRVLMESGEFRLYPQRAWKIFPDGKKEYITNFMVIGNPYEMLKQIAITGTSRKISHGICGSTSGGIRTQEIAPAAFLPRVSIQAIEPVYEKERLLERLKD